MVQKDFEKSVNRFTYQVNAVISLKNVSKSQFFDDINKIKTKQISEKDFIRKYNQLFDGTIAKFKDTNSFLGSYRRNINPKYFNQSKDKDVIQFSKDLRIQTFTAIPKRKTISKKTKSIQTKQKFEQTLVFDGLAEFEVSKLKNVWNLSFVIKNNLFGFQAVHIVVNYNLVNEKGIIVYPDLWITLPSGYSTQKAGLTLHKLYLLVYKKFKEFIALAELSNLFLDIISIQTKVYREAS